MEPSEQDLSYLKKAGFILQDGMYVLVVVNGVLKLRLGRDDMMTTLEMDINERTVLWTEEVTQDRVQEGFEHVVKRARAELHTVLENIKEMETFL